MQFLQIKVAYFITSFINPKISRDLQFFCGKVITVHPQPRKLVLPTLVEITRFFHRCLTSACRSFWPHFLDEFHQLTDVWGFPCVYHMFSSPFTGTINPSFLASESFLCGFVGTQRIVIPLEGPFQFKLYLQVFLVLWCRTRSWISNCAASEAVKQSQIITFPPPCFSNSLKSCLSSQTCLCCPDSSSFGLSRTHYFKRQRDQNAYGAFLLLLSAQGTFKLQTK